MISLLFSVAICSASSVPAVASPVAESSSYADEEVAPPAIARHHVHHRVQAEAAESPLKRAVQVLAAAGLAVMTVTGIGVGGAALVVSGIAIGLVGSLGMLTFMVVAAVLHNPM